MEHAIGGSALKKDPDRKEDELFNCVHFNSNRAVAIALKTTGSNSRIHEIVQICVYPLNTKLELAKETVPFYMDIKPLKPALNLEYRKGSVSREKYEEIRNKADMPQVVASLFDNWMADKIKPAHNKKLLVFTHNWAAMRPFLKKWLGSTRFNEYFSTEYRDIMSLALFSNDYADRHGFQLPYPKVMLSFIANILKIEWEYNEDTILHVKAMTEIYRSMMNRILPIIRDPDALEIVKNKVDSLFERNLISDYDYEDLISLIKKV